MNERIKAVAGAAELILSLPEAEKAKAWRTFLLYVEYLRRSSQL